MCGEHITCVILRELLAGSSPHVRGALTISKWKHRLVGIIPACAGSTILNTCRLERSRDHPRMCGEHSYDRYSSLLRLGSSPHVRGAPVDIYQSIVVLGIIPACAGSTMPCLRGIRLTGDHPRMCGEHMSRIRSSQMSMGSSPHVRGALQLMSFACTCCGIIPACAGSTG